MNPTHLIPPGVRVLTEPDTDRETWLRLRLSGIGGSDALAVAGLDPWRAPLGVWLEKTGVLESAVVETPLMRWGHLLEPVLAQWFEDTTGIKVHPCGMLGHPTREWQLFTPDRLTEDGGIVEIKTTGLHGAKAWANGRTADRAAIQLQHGMSVTGLSHGYAVVGIWGSDPEYRLILRDDNLIADLVAMEEEFWDSVLHGNAPALGTHPGEASLISHLYPVAGEDIVELSRDGYTALAQYVATGEQIKALKASQDALRGIVTAELEDGSEGIYNGVSVVTWRNSVSASGAIGSRRFIPRI